MQDILFYIFAIGMVFFATGVVMSRSILHSALSLVATFFVTAMLYLLMEAETIAIAQVLVYIGGVLVFIIFTILLTHRLGENKFSTSTMRCFFGLVIAAGIFSVFYSLLHNNVALQDIKASTGEIAEMKEIGRRLLSLEDNSFLVPFEVISVLLLSAMIGSVVIARREEDSESTESQEDAS